MGPQPPSPSMMCFLERPRSVSALKTQADSMSDAASGFGENVCDAMLGKAKEVSTRHGRSDSTRGQKHEAAEACSRRLGREEAALSWARRGWTLLVFNVFFCLAWIFFFFEFKNESYL